MDHFSPHLLGTRKSVDDFNKPIDGVEVTSADYVFVRLRHGVEIFDHFISW